MRDHHTRRPGRRGLYVLATVPVALTGVLVAGCATTPHYTPAARVYYVSPDGDDDHDGRSPDRPWRSLQRAGTTAFEPGDRLLLRGGARFRGSLKLDEEDAGSADKPVVVGTYGGGRARIVAANTPGISVHNTAGVEIRDVTITGGKGAYTAQGGVHVYSDRTDDKELRHVSVSGAEVSGFRVGIAIGSASLSTGFREVRIKDSVLRANKDIGLLTYGPAAHEEGPLGYAHEDVVVSGVEAYRNAGDPHAHDRHTGNGIVLGSVRGGRIEGSSAHDNGSRASSRAPEGPVGIWGYDSTRLLVQHNRSYRNHTGSRVDGAGFGLDSNVSYSTVQYNLAFRNDGPGFHAYTSKGNDAHTNNLFRFNISSDDGRKLPNNGGFDVHGKVTRNLQVYNNTVVMTNTVRPGPAIRLNSDGENVTVRNNILVTDGPLLILADTAHRRGQILLQGNDYHGTSGRWTVQWGGRAYSGLTQWRSATGQEVTDGRKTGFEADPCFRGGRAPVVTEPSDATLLVPGCDALADKGLDLRSLFGIDAGGQDYFGETLGGTLPVGAALARANGPSRADTPAS